MGKEVEILFRLPETETLDSAKNKLGDLPFHGDVHVVDDYYYDPLRAQLRPDASGRLTNSFRIRNMAGKDPVMTFKEDHFQGNIWQYSDEFEVHVGDGETAREILARLGFKPLITVDNTRRIYGELPFEVVLESVVGLGLFLEVEWKGEVGNHVVQKAEITDFIKKLGFKGQEEMNSGKPELMLRAIAWQENSIP